MDHKCLSCGRTFTDSDIGNPALRQPKCPYCQSPNFFSVPLRPGINRILSDRIESLKKKLSVFEDRLKAMEDDLVDLDTGISKFASDVDDEPKVVDEKNHPPGFSIPEPPI
jgi:predicted  nucleic acid-binding Zn-ribbon protein